jgi:nicotinic acid mononucleotide adenylyltransferase
MAIEAIGEVIIAPSFHHRWKEPRFSFEDRLAWCSAMFSMPMMTVTDMERSAGGSTWDLVQRIKVHYGRPVILVIGDDHIRLRQHWKHPDAILQLPTLIVLRNGKSSTLVRQALDRHDHQAVKELCGDRVGDMVHHH